jgi:hypothetical protein
MLYRSVDVQELRLNEDKGTLGGQCFDVQLLVESTQRLHSQIVDMYDPPYSPFGLAD